MDENTDLAKQYQDILDQYSKELAAKPITETSIPEPEIPSSIPITEVPLPPPPIVPEPALLVPPPPVVESTPPPVSASVVSRPKQSNFFKILFFISLLIFLSVCGAILFTIISANQNGAKPTPTPVSQTPTPTISTNVCQLNDKTYPVGQSFWAADSCNTCTCTADLTIVCTQKACAATPSVKLTPTKSATSSAVPATWKTYSISTDTALGLADYQIKLPPTWVRIEHSSNFQNIETFQDKLTNSMYKLTIDQEKNINPDTGKAYTSLREFAGLSYNVQSLIVSGRTAAQVLPRAGFETDNKVLFFSKDNKLTFSIELDTPLDASKVKEGETLFTQILSTFKFL